MSPRPIVLVVIMALWTLPSAGQELPDPDQLLGNVSADAERIEAYRQALRSPDANARLAAFVAMARADHPVVRQIAYEEGFASSDAQLRAMALRYAFFDRKAFNLYWGAAAPTTFEIRNSDITNGDFDVKYFGFHRWGSDKVQGQSIEFRSHYSDGDCVVRVSLDDNDRLTGEERCEDGGASDVAIHLLD